MPTSLKIALGLFFIAVIAAILGFGIISTPILAWARIAFYIAGTLGIPALFLGLLDR